MPWSVGDKRYQFLITFVSGPRYRLVQCATDCTYDLNVGPFSIATNIVGSPWLPFLEYLDQRFGVIADKQPVSDIFSISINWNSLFGQGILYDYGYQFFRILVGAVVIRAIGDDYWKPISFAPCSDEVVRSGLAGRVR